MPYVDIIYEKADDETKKNLKLAAKAFWECHAKEKYEENFAKSQEKRHRQLYCYGNCPKVDEFEVKFKIQLKFKISTNNHIQACFKPPLFTTDRGEICEPDEPRTRDGWIINSIIINENPFEKPEPPQKVKKWSGCKKCWVKFCQENPEYKIRL